MPRTVDYPRASLIKALELAKAVHELGGSSTIETAADHLGKKVSGAFNSLVSTAVKYDFIDSKKGTLAITDHFKEFIHAYDEEEEKALLRKSFFKIPIFHELYERFKNAKLPIQTLEKILIREFDVAEKIASRVSTYFVNASKETELLNSDFTFNKFNSENVISSEKEELDNKKEDKIEKQKEIDGQSEEYKITISGPADFNFSQVIKKEGDFIVIEAILNNIKEKIKA